MTTDPKFFTDEQRQTIARNIIAKFGGVTALAKILGHRHVTTVSSWWRVGIIPTKHQQDLFVLAPSLGVDLSPDDFFNCHPSETVLN